ncbi:thiamine pyrophosphate-binding protein [Aestuariicoccus sp. MJ-SS9]|uniref:thiamine pyrophosphate-binding protein n=1 Tax=Aestuariicoccus sp. MJ-SS9 TaxID=3079855 RepID=UPI00290E9A46|nr:thiamine pyrophosphate-binding protein [Aestuariicoccus sp. MJ-SS9]MDU8913162.1 thiamine pyrophosphate-binding protein [Aestuariicoccus sp. MJ-SS9]
MRGADALVRTLEAEGTDTVFTLSGNQIMPVFDACLGTRVSLVHTRHEAAAGFMAEGHAQITGRVGVALVTAGAGLGNAISPLLTARASQTPLLLMSGDSPVAKDGQGAFQEMDQIALTAPVTKLSRRITDPAMIEAELRAAIDTAMSGQPGPVHLSLPADVLEAEVGPLAGRAAPPEPALPDAGVILSALQSAQKPLILLGPELNATRAALDFASLGIPAIAMESPRGVNDPGLGRFGHAWAQADLVVALGKPVDFTLRFGAAEVWPAARWITVHGDPDEAARAERNLGRRVTALHAAPRPMARALLAGAMSDLARPTWLAEVTGLCAARSETPVAGPKIDSARLCTAVQALVHGARDPIFVSDGGEIGQWAQALIHAPRRIVNGVSGAIGGGLCYAIGAKAAAPGSDVIAVMGDGTAGFHLPEFETAVREDLPFVAVIGNDHAWNAEHELQRRKFGADRMHGCTLSGARYDQAVAALGGFGAHVTRQDELADALSEALRSGRPACVNVEIEGLPAPTPG